MDFSILNQFFSLPNDKKDKLLFDFGQTFLLPLDRKELEKACADLMAYFRHHPEKELCHNLIVAPIYWANMTKESHQQINYTFKEYLLNVLVYKKSTYISFEDNNIVWDFDSKDTRFIYKDIEDRKKEPEKKLKSSHFTLAQKDTIWSGISIGYLDVTEVKKPEKEKTKKPKKKKTEEEVAE